MASAFLAHSSSFIGDEVYIPSILSLFGIKLSSAWGVGFDSIGIVFGLSILLLIFFRNNLKSKNNLFISVTTAIIFLLSLGILGKYYPTGIGSIRFIPVFSILLCIFVGILLSNVKKKFYILIFIFLIFSLYLNYQVININFSNHSYSDDNAEKYGKFINIYNEFYDFKFINNSYSNYRFGSARFPFTKALTFVFPAISQTSGYYDQGILYETTFYKVKESIWVPDNINKSLYYMDWFGIKYFELSGGYLDSEGNYSENEDFVYVTQRNSTDFPYKIYEYKKAKPIISVLKTNLISFEKFNESSINEMAEENKNTETIIPFISKEKINISNNYSVVNFSYNRQSPDLIEVKSNFTGKEGVLFRESYYKSWKAKEYPYERVIPIYRTANDLMLIIPDSGVNRVIFYQSNSFIEYLSIFISLLCIFLMFYFSFRKSKQ